MNEKTRIQIEEMKRQTIGVEVEMNNITRENAARIAADYFGTGRYKYTADRNGYYTWSAWDTEGREWKFQRDVALQGVDSEKCELVTPILKIRRYSAFAGTYKKTQKSKSQKANATRGCGVHIHIGANGHTAQTLRNLANIMASHESLIASALNISQSRINNYCRMVSPKFLDNLNRRKPRTMSELADIWYTSNGANYGRTQHYNDSRYHMLNYHATFTKGTVEFRLFSI
mgnify:CR=1 FL=1